MATAKKTPSGRWRVLAYVGKDVTKSGYKSFTADTKKEAEAMAAVYDAKKQASPLSALTVGQAIDRYIEARRAVLSPSTIRGYKTIRRTVLLSLMPVPVVRLAQRDVQAAVNADAIAGKAPKTIRNAHGLLCAALAELRPDLRLKTVFPQKQKPNIAIPSEEEIALLLENAGSELHTAILLASQMGLRRSEICALTAEDVDHARGTITISKAMVCSPESKWVIKPPKSEAGFRTLEMTTQVAERLKAAAPSSRLLALNPNMISQRFEALQQKCFGEIRYRFHDLRHYNASVMLALGVPDKYAMERMGHATNNMLKTVYQHTMRDKQQEVSRRLTEYFNQHTTQNTTEK